MPDLDKLLNAIDAAEETAYGSDSDGELAAARALAIDYYLGRNIEPAPDGRSQVVDRSVYETIQWILPSLCRIFANGDDVVELPPVGPDDEESAKQEAAYLNYIVLQKNNWFETFSTAAKDALLTKAGYLYAYREKRRQVEIEKYERQTQEGVALILQDKPDVLSLNEYPDPDAQPVMDPVTGQITQPMLYDLEIRRVKEETAYCIRVLPPERVKVSEHCTTVQVSGADYFEYYDYLPISELRKMGLDVPDEISGDEDHFETEEDQARDQFNERTWDDKNPVDPAMRRVKTRWVWIRHDYDEDGISELQYCIVVGRNILHREECNRIPVGVLCPDPLPHRHVGLSVADTVMDIQAIKTAILRQGLDNLYLSNNPRQFGDANLVNLDDMLVSRPGGIIRTRNGAVFGQHFGVYPIPFVFPQAMQGMEYMDQIRENRTGTNRYFTGIDQNALNKTATGIQQLSTMAAQRVEQIARTFASGIETLFAILHELVLKGGHHAEVVKLRGQWVQVDPSTWRHRTDFRISVGYAAGNKDAMVSRLLLIAQLQEKAAAGGMPIVQPQNLYETAIELTKASDFAAPERFWTDPANVPPPQPPQPDPTLLAIEQIKAQNAQAIKQAELQQRERETTAELDVERYKAELDAQTKLTIAQLNPKTTEARARESKARAETDFIQQFMASQQQQTQAIAEMFQRLMEQIQRMNGPRKVIRGKDGRVEGVVPIE